MNKELVHAILLVGWSLRGVKRPTADATLGSLTQLIAHKDVRGITHLAKLLRAESARSRSDDARETQQRVSLVGLANALKALAKALK